MIRHFPSSIEWITVAAGAVMHRSTASHIRWGETAYESPSSLNPAVGDRSDRNVVLSIQLSRPIGEWLTVGIGWTWTKNDSNVGAFDYERSLVYFSFEFSPFVKELVP